MIPKYQSHHTKHIDAKNLNISNRWKEHFGTVLNRPFPPEEDILPTQEGLNIDAGEIRLEEVVTALKQLKNYKAPGEDGLFPEMFIMEED